MREFVPERTQPLYNLKAISDARATHERCFYLLFPRRPTIKFHPQYTCVQSIIFANRFISYLEGRITWLLFGSSCAWTDRSGQQVCVRVFCLPVAMRINFAATGKFEAYSANRALPAVGGQWGVKSKITQCDAFSSNRAQDKWRETKESTGLLIRW